MSGEKEAHLGMSKNAGAEAIVTACPLCKKAIGRGTKSEVRDLAEIVVAAIK
jgi:Fe-S oxidoreductase